MAAVLATLLSRVWWYGLGSASLEVRSFQIPYTAAVVVAVPIWLLLLATSRCYHVDPFGAVKDEIRRVISAGAHFLAVIAVAYYILHLERLGRGFLIAIVPLAAGLSLVGRAGARFWLRRQRDRGHAMRQAMIMGSTRNVSDVIDHLARHPRDGIVGIAALTPDNGPDSSPARDPSEQDIPVVGSPDNILAALQDTDADLLLITDGLQPGQLRRLTWQLESSGIEVLVAPAATQLIAPQLDVRPVAGLPLLYVDHAAINTNLQEVHGDADLE